MKHIQQQKKSNHTLFMNSAALTSDYSTGGGTGKLDQLWLWAEELAHTQCNEFTDYCLTMNHHPSLTLLELSHTLHEFCSTDYSTGGGTGETATASKTRREKVFRLVRLSNLTH